MHWPRPVLRAAQGSWPVRLLRPRSPTARPSRSVHRPRHARRVVVAFGGVVAVWAGRASAGRLPSAERPTPAMPRRRTADSSFGRISMCPKAKCFGDNNYRPAHNSPDPRLPGRDNKAIDRPGISSASPEQRDRSIARSDRVAPFSAECVATRRDRRRDNRASAARLLAGRATPLAADWRAVRRSSPISGPSTQPGLPNVPCASATLSGFGSPLLGAASIRHLIRTFCRERPLFRPTPLSVYVAPRGVSRG